ncbi:ISL3 family transposase [Virgibacillus kapii]|uniref:ISL3 family transposase n=1 Tax=Virgibacillus kapii TaxID=1638645 RepID=A0ABQ2DW43_9BACI|nr:ISL3 family transposase [Virgibacillus kapii]
MQFNMTLPGLEEVNITKSEEVEGSLLLHINVPRKPQRCPVCGERTRRVHDYRTQKVQHLKVFERTSYLFYRKRRYVCPCGKRFYEKNSIVAYYQRHSKEWNQALGLRVIQGKNFKDTAAQFRTSPNTAMRRFDTISSPTLKEVESLPKVIAIDEYKGDTTEGKYQVIIADGDTGKPLDILPNRSVETVKDYLREKGSKVEMVIMDMSHAFKSAVRKALGKPIIVADRFHFCRYIYWALERVRRRVQKEFHDYDRRKCKRMKHVFYKRYENLSEKQHWYLERYLGLSEELRRAYGLKEAFREWFKKAKEIGKNQPGTVKSLLKEFYQKVENAGMKEFIQAIKTLKNWQVEVLNSFTFPYSNGFIEGLNNQTKVIKRNAFGFR